MGVHDHPWQNSDAVLAFFGERTSSARPSYRAFVAKGIDHGKRAGLTGGGLIRSAGGWAAVKGTRVLKVIASIGIDPMGFAGPSFFNHGFDGLHGVQFIQPLIKGGMGIRFAYP